METIPYILYTPELINLQYSGSCLPRNLVLSDIPTTCSVAARAIPLFPEDIPSDQPADLDDQIKANFPLFSLDCLPYTVDGVWSTRTEYRIWITPYSGHITA